MIAIAKATWLHQSETVHFGLHEDLDETSVLYDSGKLARTMTIAITQEASLFANKDDGILPSDKYPAPSQ